MLRARKILALGLLMAFAGAPALRALADETSGASRAPADAATSKKKKKKKKKGKAKKSAKKRKTSKHSKKPKASGGPKSHAPKASMPQAPRYPTQPNAGAYSDIPNEKKDDLPAPQTPPND